MAMLQQLKSNPGQFIRNMGYTVPDDVLSDPMGIVQHLANSGQFNQQQMQMYNQAMGQQRAQNGAGAQGH